MQEGAAAVNSGIPSTIQDYEGGRKVFDVISQEEAAMADYERCNEMGGVAVGSMLMWGGDDLWRRRGDNDTQYI